MAAHSDGPGAHDPSSPDPLEIEIAESSLVGHARPSNEDSARHCVPDDGRLRARKGILCLVADGMGGHRAGEIASRQAVELVMRHYYAEMSRDVAGSLARALSAANSAIAEQSEGNRSQAGMGTTLVAAVIRGSHVVVANVGDSRAYHVGERGIAQITRDHSWVEEQVQEGFLTPDQARTHPYRNLVTRALGTRPQVEPDLYEGAIAAGDCLVLCTDGLSNQVQDAEIESAVRSQPPGRATQALVDLVQERGGRDDATVLVVRAGGEAAGDRRPRPDRATARWTALLAAAAVVLGLLALLLYLRPGL